MPMPDPRWRDDPEDRTCPACGAPIEIGDWWDDSERMGGAIIGTLLSCTQCSWEDAH